MGIKTKIGILGGGQLGRMLYEASIGLDIEIHFMDPDPHAPCKYLGRSFTAGDINDPDSVFQFGKDKDVISIEIERVSVEGLTRLNEIGKKVFPSPQLIAVVQDKILQKQFFQKHQIPTAPFEVIQDLAGLKALKKDFPFVNKIGVGGYDGRGVQLVRNEADIQNCFDAPGIVEDLADIDKEISVIACRNEEGQTETFPAVEMVFDARANLVDYLISPAEISLEEERKAQEIARELAQKMDLVGVMAVEMFLLKNGQIWVNEVAPRPHNSGHQSIEGNYSSQYDQHLRALLGLPMLSPPIISPSAMVNLLGAEGYEGEAKYEGIEEVLRRKDAYIHIYGKKLTKPFRKMGHVTVLGKDKEELIEKINFVKRNLKVIA